jgi:hypothetical protein
MFTYIMKVSDRDGQEYYLEWDPLNRKPATKGLPLSEFKKQYLKRRGSDQITALDSRIKRADRKGCSSYENISVEELIAPLSKEEILNQYCRA